MPSKRDLREVDQPTRSPDPYDPAVVPCLDDALALEHRQLFLDLIAQIFISVAVAK